MQKSKFVVTNFLIFILALISVFAIDQYGQELIYLLVFPLLVLAKFLRTISLSSTSGNIIALIIFGLVAISPLLVLAWFYFRKKLIKTDLLLIVLSLAIGLSLYYLINPSNGLTFTSYYALSPLVESILFAYVILRIISKLRQSDLKTITRYSRYLIIAFMISFAFTAYFVLLYSFKSAASQDALTGFIEFLKALINAITYGLISYILKKIADLCLLYEKDQYHQDLPILLKKINQLLTKTLIIIPLAQVFLHLLYVILGVNISNVESSISFPFLILVFLLIGLFIMRLFEDLLTLKDDNDLMI